MRGLKIIYMLVILAVAFGITACSKEQDNQIREKTDLGLGEMVKAKDRALASSVTQSLNSDPRLTQYKLKAEVSHDKIVLTGTVSSEAEKQLAFEIATKVDLDRLKPENITNDIQIDPTLEPILGPDDY